MVVHVLVSSILILHFEKEHVDYFGLYFYNEFCKTCSIITELAELYRMSYCIVIW